MSKLTSVFRRKASVPKKDTSITDFIIGIILIVVGLYFIFKNTSIGVLFMDRLFGTHLPGGIVTIPALIGIAIVFFKHRSVIGWGLIAIGAVLIVVQIIMSLRITFNTTSLLDYFFMFGGFFGGLGLIGRACLR